VRKIVCIALVSLLAACSGNNQVSPPAGDLTAPQLSVTYGSDTGTSPQAGSTLKLAVQGSASDNQAITKVTYQVNDGAEKMLQITSGKSVTFKFFLTLLPGTTKITVNAYDAAGNRGRLNFTLTWTPSQPAPPPLPSDTTAPTVSLTSPANNATLSSGNVTVKGEAKDNAQVTRVSYKLNGGAETDFNITKGATASFSATLTLKSGANTVQVNAYDDAGNRGSASLSLTYTPSSPNPPPPPLPTSGGWWKPTPNAPISWHWQLSQDFQVPRDLKPGVKVYDFDKDMMATPDTVQKLKSAVPGAIAICYIDVGVYEDYRPDKQAFLDVQNQYRKDTGDPNAKLWGNADVGWPGSYWLDVRQTKYLLPLMEARIKDCKAKGFDAVEPDESEVWNNNPGFPISMEQSHAYTKMIADLVHSYGLSVGLKGNNGEAAVLEPYHDWALTEQCFEYSECQNFVDSFVKNGKAVFNIEYSANPDCTFANKNHINSAKRDLDLVGPTASGYSYKPCMPDGSTAWP